MCKKMFCYLMFCQNMRNHVQKKETQRETSMKFLRKVNINKVASG